MGILDEKTIKQLKNSLLVLLLGAFVMWFVPQLFGNTSIVTIPKRVEKTESKVDKMERQHIVDSMNFLTHNTVQTIVVKQLDDKLNVLLDRSGGIPAKFTEADAYIWKTKKDR